LNYPRTYACFSLAFIISLCASVKAGAEESRGNALEDDLGRIVVTATRSGSALGDVSENIELTSADGGQAVPGTHLSELLQYIPGVDLEPRSSPGQPTSLSIQGSDSRQVRLMIDGIPFNTQASGQADPSLLPTGDIARIEVIKGPGSSVWGSSLGGVVNVITKDTGTTLMPRGTVSSAVGGYGTEKQSVELSGKALDLGYYLMADYLDSGGKGPRDDALEKKWFNKFSYTLPDEGKLMCSFGYSGADVNIKFPDGTWSAQPYRVRYGKLGLEDDFGGTQVKAELKHSRQDLITRSFGDLSDDTPQFEVTTLDRLYELSLTASRRFRSADTLVIGTDLDYDTLKSDPYLAEQKDLFSSAPYANYTLNAGRWDFIFGSRYDYNSMFGDNISPSFGTVYRFGDPWVTLVRSRVTRAFNAPPLLWKFNDNPALGVAPNPNIKAERGVSYELEAESSPCSRLRLKASAYLADIHDALNQEEVSPGLFAMNNFEKFRRQGVELGAKFKVTRELSLLADAAFNDIENRVTGETVKGGGKPRQSLDAGIEYAAEMGFSCSIQGYYKRWNEPASLESNDRKFIADLKARQLIGKNLSVFFNVYNVTNSAYWADSFYPLRKRYFESGLTFTW
jgi:vitamin B12 transporter